MFILQNLMKRNIYFKVSRLIEDVFNERPIKNTYYRQTCKYEDAHGWMEAAKEACQIRSFWRDVDVGDNLINIKSALIFATLSYG